ncbi:MAG TPA: type IV secretory system conjugative DNA transfer family protein [Candidatus Angelobacter sp.]|nr:type IV secretory system conjugative DNA transfer family protein [Candidatus Angelobacter sp.]
MINHNSYEYGRREYHRTHEDNAGLVLLVFFFALLGVAFFLLVSRFHIRRHQIVEFGLYLIGLAGALVSLSWHIKTRKARIENAWPHPAVFIPMLRDGAYLEEAFEQKAIVPGYDIYGHPWFWSDDSRRMQTVVVGQSGSGKTTLLHNLASQDIRRKVDGGHLPVILFDGKGDQQFLHDLVPEIAAAGRLHQLRILDPFRPEISVRFNPLYKKGGSSQELVNAFFDSFMQRQDFFRGHQAAYLSDICRVLDYTGNIYNIHDVLVMARDELVLKEQIHQASQRISNGSHVSVQQRQNFEMSAKNLLQSLQDRERLQKIQGLLNELGTFTEDDLSVITNAYDDLLTLDEIVEQELILFVSLNTNKNTRAVTALGRMLLQNLQLLVGQRYLNEQERRDDNRPMVSVILDEFAPFAYPNFAQILQTARGSNTALLFSLQSIPQLRSVSRSFGDDVASAPNTIMLLRTRDEETARYFLNASARVTSERHTMTVEKKGVLQERYEEIGFGSVTEIEKTRAVDFEIKNLPVGQMQILTTDNRLGTLHMHIHVRRPRHCSLASFEPVVYQRLHRITAHHRGANLRFKSPDLARRMNRIFGKGRVA